MTENHRRPLAGIALLAAVLGASTAAPALAQTAVTDVTACRAEVEPNDSLEQAVTLEAERCVSGTLLEAGDRDMFVWQVDEEAAVDTWSFSLLGAPGVQSTAHVLRLETGAETGARELGNEVGQVVFEADGPADPASADLALAAGEYAIVLDRADATVPDPDVDASYELRWAPSAALSVDAAVDQARLVVSTADATAPLLAAGGAVELLMDTSGSMLTRLGQTTKLEAAERSLVSLVDQLPAGLPVALRTFKDEPRSCATVLRVPADPLRPKAMARTIRDLPARRGTRTPIAKALSKVPQDLRGVDGHRIVVLVTDGKEDCGGDPAAAIRALADAGYTSTVHIIGYALPDDSDARDSLAEWAALGGGRYFEAPDAASLDAALTTALTTPYLVFDTDDVLVAQGLVDDDGVELEVGTYRVDILTEPISSTNVELEAGAVVEVPLTPADSTAG